MSKAVYFLYIDIPWTATQCSSQRGLSQSDPDMSLDGWGKDITLVGVIIQQGLDRFPVKTSHRKWLLILVRDLFLLTEIN